MPLDLRILLRKPLNLVLAESPAKAGIQLAGQLVVELAEQFGIEEEVGGSGEFVCDGVEEDFGTVILVLARGALFGFDGEEAQAEDVDAVAEEDCFSAWCVLAPVSSFVDELVKVGDETDLC